MAISGRRVTRLAKLLLDVGWWLALVGPVAGAALLLAWPTVTSGGIDSMTAFRVSVSDEVAAERLPIVSGDTVVAADPVLKDVEATLEFRTTVVWPLLFGGVRWYSPVATAKRMWNSGCRQDGDPLRGRVGDEALHGRRCIASR